MVKTAPTAAGSTDMAGNVYEWCWDWYDAGWYSNGGATTTETRGTNSSLLGARDAGRFVGRRHVLTGLRQWLPQRRSGVRGQLRRISECEGALTFFLDSWGSGGLPPGEIFMLR